MADKTKKVAIQLSLDVDKQGAVAQVKSVTEQMKKILTSFEKSGGSFEIFNDLVGYLKAVEEQCLRLKNINPVKFNDLFGKEGGADLNSAISSQITGILDTAKQVPDVIAKVQDKINNLKNQTSIKVGEVRDIGNDIKGLYTLMGQTPKIDLDFKGQRGNVEQLDVLSNALKNFKVDWLEFVNTIKDNPNPLNDDNKIAGSGKNPEIEIINKKIEELKAQKQTLTKIFNAINENKLDKQEIEFTFSSEEEMLPKLQELVAEFKKAEEAKAYFEQRKDTSSEEYLEAVKKYIYAAKLLVSARSKVEEDAEGTDAYRYISEGEDSDIIEKADASLKRINDKKDKPVTNIKQQVLDSYKQSIKEIDTEIEKLQNDILGITQEPQSTITSTLSKITNGAENAATKVENMALRIEKAFDMVHDADVEFRITVGDQGLDIRSGAANEIDIKTLVENYLANINKGITLGAHSHRGISSGWSVDDVREAIKSQFLGLSKVNAVFGDRDITSINFSGVSKEIADQILSAIENDANMKQSGELKAEGINRIAKQFGAGDIAKVWDVSNGIDNFVKYINEIESASQAAIEPVDRLKNLLTYLKPNIDFSKYNVELKAFTDGTSSVADVFNKIAKSESISTIVDNTNFSSLSDMTAKMAQQQEEYQDKLYDTELTFKEVLDMVQQVKDAGANRSDIENVFGNIFNTKDLRDISSLFEKMSNPLDIAKNIVAKFDYDPYDDILDMVQTMIPNEEMSLTQLQELLNKRKELMGELLSSDDISDKDADSYRRDEIAQEEAINKTLEERISFLNELALKNQDVSGKEIEQQNITNQDQTAQLEKEKALMQELEELKAKLNAIPTNPVDASELEIAKKQAQDLEDEIQRMQGSLDEWKASYSDLLNNTVPADELDNMTENGVVDGYRDKIDWLQSTINQLNEELVTTKAALEELNEQAVNIENKTQEGANNSSAIKKKTELIQEQNSVLEQNNTLQQKSSEIDSSTSTNDTEIKALREQVSQLELQLAQAQLAINSGTQIDTSSEVNNLEILRVKLEEVKNAVEEKTRAFEEEYITVDGAVEAEIVVLQNLIDKINNVAQILNQLFSNLNSGENIANGLSNVNINVNGNTDEAASNSYALESTLEKTNTILGEIKSSVDTIGKTTPKNPRPTSEANARIADSKEYEHIKDIALNSIGDKGTDPQITGVKALADGLVQVNGYIKTAEGNYENFVVKVNEANETIGLAFSDNKKLTQQMQAEAAAQEAFSNNWDVAANEFIKYTDAINQSDQVTAKFSNQIQQMESRLATVSNGEELDAWKADWDALTASIAAAKQEQEKLILEGQKRKDAGTLNSVGKSATEIYKSLKIDPTKMTPELEEIRRKYLDIVSVIEEYKKKREALTQEEINGLKQAEAELQKEAQAYAQKMQAEQKQKEDAQKAYGAGQVKNLEKKYIQLSGVASGAEFTDSTTVQSALSALETSYQRLVDKQKEFVGIDPTAEQKQEFAQLTDQYNRAYVALDNIIKSSRKLQEQGVGDPYEIVSGTNMADEGVRRQELQNAVNLFSNGTAEVGKFNTEVTTLSYTVKNADGTFTEFTAVLDSTGTKIVNVAGKAKESTSLFKGAFDSIKKKSKEILTYMVSMGGLSRVMGQIRQGIQYVKEIDTALTELKKVTDETDATYKRFLQTASQASSEIGSTIADFTNATADFARLGYSITEATDLAKAASIYKNVGDGINSVSDASESIISTMKAFGIEANNAMSIVDRFNEVGKILPLDNYIG